MAESAVLGAAPAAGGMAGGGGQGASEDYFTYASYAAGADGVTSGYGGVPLGAGGVDGDDFDASVSERGIDKDGGPYRDDDHENPDDEPDALEELAEDAEEAGVDPTCRDVQEAINISHPFGLRIWKPALYRKFRSIDARTAADLHSVPGTRPSLSLFLNPWNLLWLLMFGWWLSLLYVLVACLALGPVAFFGSLAVKIGGGKWRWARSLERLGAYAKVLLNLATYVLWPFGKFVARRHPTTLFEQPMSPTTPGGNEEPNERTALLSSHHEEPEYFSDNATDDEPTPRAPALPRRDSVVVDVRDTVGREDGSKRPNMSRQRSTRADTPSIRTEDMWSEYSFTPPPDLDHDTRQQSHRNSSQQRSFASILFKIIIILTIAPAQTIISGICFLCIFSMPMAQVNWVLLKELLNEPLEIWSGGASGWVVKKDKNTRNAGGANEGANAEGGATEDERQSVSARRALTPSGIFTPDVESGQNSNDVRPISTVTAGSFYEPVVIPTTLIGDAARVLPPTPATAASSTAANLPPSSDHIILCTYHAAGFGYWKFTVDGVNIILFNLLFVTFFCLFDFYVLTTYLPNSVITSTKFIFFLSLLATVPLAYFIGMGVASITSLTGNLALGAVVNATFGSVIEILLYCLALMEGKEGVVQGAIVGSLLAGLLALPGVSMFAGGMRFMEQRFNAKSASVTSTLLIVAIGGLIAPTVYQEVYGGKDWTCLQCTNNSGGECKYCRVVSTPPEWDDVYWRSTRWLMYACAFGLVVVYIVGMVFMLRTHRGRIYGHGAGGGAERDRTSAYGGAGVGTGGAGARQSGAVSEVGEGDRRKGRGRKGELRVSTNVGTERGLGTAPGLASASSNYGGYNFGRWEGDFGGSGVSTSAVTTPVAGYNPHHLPPLHPGPPAMERISSQASAAGATSSPRLQPRDNRDRERHVAHTSGLSPYVQPRYSTNPSLVSSPRLRPDGGDEGDDGEGWLRRRNVNARTWHGDHRERPERERTTTTSTGVPLPPPLPHAPNSTVNIDSKRRGSFSAAGGSVVVQRHAHGTAASTVAGHGGGGGGHDHPNWSLKKSFAVLLACTVLYSLVAEVLIDSLDVVLGAEEGEFEDGSGKGGGSIGEKFLGVTIVAIVPTVTEFYNAIAFSINDNIALSLEIGSAYAMQVALLQIPVMVGFSVWMGLSGGGGSSESEMVGAFGGAAEAGVMRVGANRFMLPKSGRLEGGKVSRTVDDGFRMPFRKYMEIFRRGFGSSAATPHSHAEPLVASSPSTSFVASSNPDPQTKPKSLKPFTLIFPKWDIATILFAVFLLTFIFNEGRSDYFKGSVLCVVYLICLGSFWVEGR